MGFGEVLWVRRSESLAVLLGSLGRLTSYGLRLTHPQTGGVRYLAECGPMETTLDALLTEVNLPRPLTLQLWINVDTDVLTSVSTHGGMVVVEFDLDGLTTDEAHRAVAAVLWLAVTDTASLGLVVDSRLPDTGTEWEGFFLNGSTAEPHMPELLWQPQASSLRLAPQSWLFQAHDHI
ncbi:hypothetical protein SAMN05421811_1097 [Nonomuraea wenchangensis]|uniref:Uncharacterized protein n=2 Tax=Streptosporangiaceae TaxID=2004 RepID=A0A1I0KP52_9ACTN|nr:hypothetical protein SAMN05421811_1097 [Nonomuraea wenchangensis]